ncbi:hypothetical protein niasHT_012971 [Heterodera trifolii]|uniref:BTB domain-containing protein n=1 Tax=Heterodera trifolii TaxID=157864 RepID=A0ABD2L3L3_9BILA
MIGGEHLELIMSGWMKKILSADEEEAADVHFLVGEGDGKETVPAHKVILKHASDVFEAMFRFDSQNANAHFRHFVGLTRNAVNMTLSAPLQIVVPSSARHFLKFVFHSSQRKSFTRILFPSQKRISYPTKATIWMEIEKMSEFSRKINWNERKSKTVHIKGLRWRILAGIRKPTERAEKRLSFFLWCDAASEKENWRCKCSAILRIVTQKKGVFDFSREFEDHEFDSKCSWRGFTYFIAFSELMDPSKGFYNREEDKVTLAIDVTVKEAKTDNS